MNTLTEGELQLSLPVGARGRCFDDPATHGLTHCMKAVDLIVETADRIWFIEFKDPEHSRAGERSREVFLHDFRSGRLDNDLKTKYRDSWLYEHAQGRLAKPVHFAVLIACSTLMAAELLNRTEALRRQLPLRGPGGRAWPVPHVAGCAVMNMGTWNRYMQNMPVTRLVPGQAASQGQVPAQSRPA